MAIRACLFVLFLACLLESVSFGEERNDFSNESERFVKKHWNIVWARAVKAELHKNKQDVTYTFEVVEIIRGNQGEPFQIEASILGGSAIQQQLYLDHDALLFRESLLGRGVSLGEAEIRVSFEIGWEYLIFMDMPVHIRSYEIIRSEDDAWLRYVKETVGKQSLSEDEIRDVVMHRQMTIHINNFLWKHRDIDKVKFVNLSNTSYEFIKKNPDATNEAMKQFFSEQANAVLKEGHE